MAEYSVYSHFTLFTLFTKQFYAFGDILAPSMVYSILNTDSETRFYGRDEVIFDAYASGGYSLKEIGDHFRLYYSRVSRM